MRKITEKIQTISVKSIADRMTVWVLFSVASFRRFSKSWVMRGPPSEPESIPMMLLFLAIAYNVIALTHWRGPWASNTLMAATRKW